MTAHELARKLLEGPDVEVLMRTVTGADYEIEWEPVTSVEPVRDERVWVERDGKFGYQKVPCIRLYD